MKNSDHLAPSQTPYYSWLGADAGVKQKTMASPAT
jgi:hypothetical protein